MSGRRWVEDDGILILDSHSNDPLRFTRGHMGEITDAEYDDLVQCVRDAQTLAEARQVARTVAAFADPVKPGSPLGALLDLLTEPT